MKKTRFLIVAFAAVVLLGACGVKNKEVSREDLLVGTWVNLTTDTSDGEKIEYLDTLIYNADKTWESRSKYFLNEKPTREGTTFSGTWQIVGDSISHVNSYNNVHFSWYIYSLNENELQIRIGGTPVIETVFDYKRIK